MLSADLHLGSRVRLFANFKSGIENGRNGRPRPTDEDRLDVHETFVDFRLGEKRTSIIRIGRRELAFGSQRLVSVRGSPNVRRTFDGVSVIVAPGSWRLEAFATKPVTTEVGVFDDNTDHTQTFWGVYATGPLRLFKDAGIDIYYFGLDRKVARFEQGTAPELRETVGARLWRRAAPWDYNFEVIYQWGRFGSGPIRAWTFASDSGLTLRTAAWRPRFGLKADITSGDQDPTEPTLQSFNPLFPRGAYFGENQLIGPVNHIDLHPSVDLRPLPRVTLTPSWLFFWRQSTKDGVYGVPGNLIRPARGATARYVGSQPSMMVTVRLGRHTSVAADWEYFIAGPFLRESGSARNCDVRRELGELCLLSGSALRAGPPGVDRADQADGHEPTDGPLRPGPPRHSEAPLPILELGSGDPVLGREGRRRPAARSPPLDQPHHPVPRLDSVPRHQTLLARKGPKSRTSIQDAVRRTLT